MEQDAEYRHNARMPNSIFQRISRALVPGVAALLLGSCGADRALDNATRFAARLTCSCVFVTGRDLLACIADLPEHADLLDIRIDLPRQSVIARAFWVTGEARFEEGLGCKLVD